MKGFTVYAPELSDAELVNFFRQTDGVQGLFVRIDGDQLGVVYLDEQFPESQEAFLDFSRQFFSDADWKNVEPELNGQNEICSCGDGNCGVGPALMEQLGELSFNHGRSLEDLVFDS